MFEMSLYHNPQIISWHKHTAKTSQMDTATQTEFCHWERQQTNLLTLEKKKQTRTPLALCLPHHYLYPKGPAGTLGCLGYSSSAAVQRKLQP